MPASKDSKIVPVPEEDIAAVMEKIGDTVVETNKTVVKEHRETAVENTAVVLEETRTLDDGTIVTTLVSELADNEAE